MRVSVWWELRNSARYERHSACSKRIFFQCRFVRSLESWVGYPKFRVVCFKLGWIWGIQGSFRFKTATADLFREVSGSHKIWSTKIWQKNRNFLPGTWSGFRVTTHLYSIPLLINQFLEVLNSLYNKTYSLTNAFTLQFDQKTFI